MKTKTILIPLFILIPIFSFAWGAAGHQMVADIAKQKLNPGIEAKVQQFLDSTTFEKAATWMDDVRSEHTYDYMKTWHYVNIEKGDTYVKNPKGDVVSELNDVMTELKNYPKMKAEDVKKDLEILFHLCGDITQPLHDGYGSDKGGNDVTVTFNVKQTNLHHVWDIDIIDNEKITVDSCMKVANAWTPAQLKSIEKMNTMDWMSDARAFLPQVYDFSNGTLTQAYADKNKIVVEQQLAKGGFRLATVLNKIFGGK